MDHIAGGDFPLQSPSLRVKSVLITIAAAEVHKPVIDGWRGEIHVPGIRDGLIVGLVSVQTLGLEPAFTTGLEFPLQLAGLSVHGIELSVIAAEIDQAAGNRGRGMNGALS